ncbi:MAG TPA: hypothetical protein RMF84_06925, partial [Polyangiaceae bacterium LLY-WYZ-14_1]|nr:hypothetical protein [Polyangiaceae bacterium LLY-WYZ-14_1]
MSERYDVETLAALARPSVAPPTSLEDASSVLPDDPARSVVDLRALRDSLAPAPPEQAGAGPAGNGIGGVPEQASAAAVP